ncbi:MAG: tRNA adenosine(34) deaminase TadA [Acidobacteria bacterium]|nr:tRNA adenosine(34) deaminase TadA [Acidobacteriota bacterium]
MPDKPIDTVWMELALDEAGDALALDEVPVGAIVVIEEKIVGRGFNRNITDQDPTAHAEIVALRDAARMMRNHRLPAATMYVTVEPCVMCAGAMIQARIARLVYGAADPKAGAVDSVFQLCNEPALNHRIETRSGVLEEKCREMLVSFLRKKREEPREADPDS